jgi:hypothetical protein
VIRGWPFAKRRPVARRVLFERNGPRDGGGHHARAQSDGVRRHEREGLVHGDFTERIAFDGGTEVRRHPAEGAHPVGTCHGLVERETPVEHGPRRERAVDLQMAGRRARL